MQKNAKHIILQNNLNWYNTIQLYLIFPFFQKSEVRQQQNTDGAEKQWVKDLLKAST